MKNILIQKVISSGPKGSQVTVKLENGQTVTRHISNDMTGPNPEPKRQQLLTHINGHIAAYRGAVDTLKKTLQQLEKNRQLAISETLSQLLDAQVVKISHELAEAEAHLHAWSNESNALETIYPATVRYVTDPKQVEPVAVDEAAA